VRETRLIVPWPSVLDVPEIRASWTPPLRFPSCTHRGSAQQRLAPV